MNVSVRRLPLLILAVFGLATHGSHAQSVATSPVGYLQNTIAPSVDGTTRVYTALSFPLHATPVFVGTVSAVSVNTITVSGSLPSGLAVSGSTPYMVHVTSAASSIGTGQTFFITAATTNTITVSSPTYNVSTVLAANDSISIRAAETLGSIFGSTDATVLLKGGVTANASDLVLIWNGTAYNRYYYWPTFGWWQDNATSVQNNTVIYPDEGVLVGRISQNVLPATYAASMGAVPINNQIASMISAPGLTLVSNPLPTDLTLGTFGFRNSPSWLDGTSASNADNVLLWNGSSWQTYYYFTGYGWYADNGSTEASAQPIPAGSSVMVRRRGTVTGTNAYIPIALNYTP